MVDTHTTPTVTRWLRAGWAINALPISALLAILFLRHVSVWFVVGGVVVITVVNLGLWIGLRRAVVRGSHPPR